MFMTLFRYISGANDGQKKISMTSPVSMHMTKKSEVDNSFEKEMCFYLDGSQQGNPPQPTNSEVYLTERSAMTIYTRYTDKPFSLVCPYESLIFETTGKLVVTWTMTTGLLSPMHWMKCSVSRD